MAVPNRFPTGGGIPDDLNTTPAEVLEGYKFIGSLQDDIEVGTLKITGNANANHVLKDKTFYTIDPKQIMTGIMEVNNVSNLVLSLVSGRNVTVKWTNPTVTTGRPYSGVYVRYQTGSYPTSTTGTQAYKGVGSTSSAGSISQVTLALPNLNTTYYFIVYSYCTTSNGELLGTQLKGTIKTGSSQVITIKSTQNYTIPAGYNSVDLFCVGGGGGGGGGAGAWGSSSIYTGGTGGGCYTKSTLNVTVSPGQVLSSSIYTGGTGGSGGGGNGGMGNTGSGPHGGAAGGTNTGGAGGGGGGGARSSSSLSQSEGLGGQGGSGIVLIRLK